MKNIDKFEPIKLKTIHFITSKRFIKILILCLFFIFNYEISRAENGLENQLASSEISDEQAHYLVLHGTPDDVKQLLQSGYDVNKVYLCDTLLYTAIKSSVRGKNASKFPSYALEKIKILVSAGANINFVACPGLSMPALHLAVHLPSELKDMEYDVNNVIDERIKNKTEECDFPGVVTKPCAEVTPDERKKIRAAIHDAMKYSYDEFVPNFMKIIEYLVTNGANINQKAGTLNSTPIHMASMNPQEITSKPLQYLIEKGANINIQDLKGNTPLFWAYGIENNDAINILIKKGADKDIKNNAGVLYDAVIAKTKKTFIDNKGNIISEEL